jgi:hypothetical protein
MTTTIFSCSFEGKWATSIESSTIFSIFGGGGGGKLKERI